MDTENPIFSRLPAVLAGHAPTPHSTCYEPPKRRSVPPIIGEIIGKLGLRYRPSGAADLEAHAEALVLLAEDCADMPPPLLDAAAREWARNERFMPRASELRSLAMRIQGEALRSTDTGAQQLRDQCDKLNQSEARMGSGYVWRVFGEPGERRIDRVRA